MPVPKCRQDGEQRDAATELGPCVGLHTPLCGMALRVGVLREVDTGSSGRASWGGEEWELRSAQRWQRCVGSSLWAEQAGPERGGQEQGTDEQGWGGGTSATHWLVKK